MPMVLYSDYAPKDILFAPFAGQIQYEEQGPKEMKQVFVGARRRMRKNHPFWVNLRFNGK
jgi:hypothetical protein